MQKLRLARDMYIARYGAMYPGRRKLLILMQYRIYKIYIWQEYITIPQLAEIMILSIAFLDHDDDKERCRASFYIATFHDPLKNGGLPSI